MAFSLEKLVLPDFSTFSVEQFVEYIQTTVKKYSIDRQASLEIKDAMRPVVLQRIKDLISSDITGNLSDIKTLTGIYGYTRTGIIFNPIYSEDMRSATAEELIQSITEFFLRDPSEQQFYEFGLVIGNLSLLSEQSKEA